MKRLLLVLGGVAGCYSPDVVSCAITCSETEACPRDLACVNGYCLTDPDDVSCTLHELAIRVTGDGTVVGSDGLVCNGTCTVALARGSHQLHAVPGDNARVASWSFDGTPLAACSNIDCIADLELDATHTFEVVFDAAKTLSIVFPDDGIGTITDNNGFDCTTDANPCVGRFPPGATVELVATPTAPSIFTAWAGCASNPQSDTCGITLAEDAAVSAEFQVTRISVAVLPAGLGDVEYVDFQGVARPCNGTCTFLYPPDAEQAVQLTARPIPDHELLRWINLCDGQRTTMCESSVAGDTEVFALFQPFPLVSVVTANGEGRVMIREGGASGTIHEICGEGFVADACQHRFPTGTLLRLEPFGNKLNGHDFSLMSWNGNCPAGLTANPCSFTVNENVSVAPSFGATLSVFTDDADSGVGEVAVEAGTSSFPCQNAVGTPCTVTLRAFTPVKLMAQDLDGTFARWQGCPDPMQQFLPICQFTMLRPTTVRAIFN